MKRLLIFFLMIIVGGSLSAQNLTLSEVISLNGKAKWEQADALLKKKGWTFYETSQVADGKTVIWSYKKEKDSGRALAWIEMLVVNGKPAKVAYSFAGEAVYKNIKKATLLLKLKETSSDVKTDVSAITYSNSNSWVVLSSISGKLADKLVGTPATSYQVDVFPKFGMFDNVNGQKVEKYDNGTTKREYTLRSGKIDGPMKEYFPGGKMKLSSTYSMGKRQGLETAYDESGNILSEKNYTDDVEVGEFKLYSSGKLKRVGFKVNGKCDGSFVDYDSNGRIEAKYSMKADSLYGRYTQNIYGNGNGVVVVSGDYENGAKSGYWEKATVAGDTKDVLEYSTYLFGVKDGKFKEFQGDSLLIGSYKVGKLDGRVEVYIFTEKDSKVNTPLTNAVEVAYYTYSNGILNGLYERRDHDGVVMAKGNMVNGRKEGTWLLAKRQPGEDGALTYIFQKGEFMRDSKVGEWLDITADNIPLKRYPFKNGKIEGTVTEYSWSGKPLREKIIENGLLTALNLYDSLGKSIKYSVSIVKDIPAQLTCKVTTTLNDGAYSVCSYWMKKDAEAPVDPNTFEKEFLQKSLKESGTAKGGPDGDFKEYSKSGEVLVEGKYDKGKKSGKWKRYYYPMDIIILTDYSANPVVDTYLDLPTGKLYSGRYVEAYDNGQIKCERKIYSGLVDGKVRYFNRDGKVEREETYNQGVLKR